MPISSNSINPHLLLDTHVFIWLMQGDTIMSPRAKDKILQTSQQGYVGICAISFWEISMLYARKRLILNQPCSSWIQKSLEAPGISLYPLTPEVSVESCSLPGDFKGDPASRLIVASARLLNVPLVTRDEAILTYARDGHLACLEA